MSAQGNALGNLHAMISSPNGAALIFAVTTSNLFRSAPLGLFVPDIPKPRALPWADLWLARWAGTQTELHSNAACWAASNFSDTHTADDSITTVIHRAILNRRLVPMMKMMVKMMVS